MKTSLQARFSVVIVGFIAILGTVLSGILYAQFNSIMEEIRDSNSTAMTDALIGQAKVQAVDQTHYLANTLTNDLYQYRIDKVTDIAAAAKMQNGVAYVLVYDARGDLVSDGTQFQASFDQKPSVDLPPNVASLEDNETIIDGDILHAAAPIVIGSRHLGEVKIGFSLAIIERNIEAARDALAAITARGRHDHVWATGGGMLVLAALGAIFSLIVSRWLVRPIEADFGRRQADLEKANQALVTEISERQRTESRFAQLQSELAHMARLGTVGELAGGLAHELNQPLSVISSYASGALARMRSGTAKPNEMADAFERVVEQVGRAGEIIRWIREFVRKGEPRRESVDVNAVVNEAITVLGNEPGRYGVDVQLDLGNSLPLVAADKIQVQQAILNLTGNALDSLSASPKGGKIIIRSFKKGRKFVQVDVEDSGPGLAPEARDKAFDPFFTTKPHGLGLGLSLSRSIIETHGGELWATSGAECGAIFHFTLPIEGAGRRDDDA